MNLNETNVSEYGKDTNENAMKKLYFKVHDVIKDAKMQKLAVDSCNIKAEGISFIGNFTGKNTLQLERIKNVKLKIDNYESKRTIKKVRNESSLLIILK